MEAVQQPSATPHNGKTRGKELNLLPKHQGWCNAYLGKGNVLPCLCFTVKSADCARHTLTDCPHPHTGEAGDFLYMKVFLSSNSIWFYVMILISHAQTRQIWVKKAVETKDYARKKQVAKTCFFLSSNTNLESIF